MADTAKKHDKDPLMRAASQGFAEPPTPEPTTEQVQRAMNPKNYDEWKELEEARLRRNADIKDAALLAQQEADEDIRKKQDALNKKNAEAAREAGDKAAYQTRQMQSHQRAVSDKKD